MPALPLCSRRRDPLPLRTEAGIAMKKNFRVMIAEDDPAFRRVIEFMLRREGVATITAKDGIEALHQLESAPCDLLVTDAQMPNMGGIELIEQVRGHKSLGSLPIILCTAKGLEIDSEQMMHKYSLTAIFHKPFSPTALIEAIRSRAELI